MEAGQLRRGPRPLKVKKTKISEDHSKVSREGADDLTDADSGRSGHAERCINVDHMGEKFWGPPMVDADWHAFCQAIHKGCEGSEW